jgi:hypothetical protein
VILISWVAYDYYDKAVDIQTVFLLSDLEEELFLKEQEG